MNTKNDKNKATMNELKESIQNVRIDGIPNVFNARLSIFKVIWIITFLILSSCCLFLIRASFLEYFRYQVTTNLRMNSESKSTFPTISFYNLNPLNTYYYIDLLARANMTYLNTTAYHNEILLEYYYKQKYGRYLTYDEKKAMFDMEGFIITCTFQRKPCNPRYFRYLFNPFLLSCIQFNSGFDSEGNKIGLLQAELGGKYNELTIEFYLGLPNPLADLIPSRGVKIFMHNNTEYPFKNSPSPVILTPGVGLTVTASRMIYNQCNKWPYTYSTCTVNQDGSLMKPLDDDYLFNATLASGYAYSQDTCFMFCFQLYNRFEFLICYLLKTIFRFSNAFFLRFIFKSCVQL